MNNKTLRIAGIVPESIVDGPGIRFTIFVQGCPHHCEGCHNPKTHDFSLGTDMSIAEIYAQLVDKPYISGVTFSGGEPFCQCESLACLACELKKLGKHIMAYSGYTFEELSKMPDAVKLLSYIDILVDGRFEKDKKSLELKFRGSSNQRILDVKASLNQGKAILSDKYN